MLVLVLQEVNGKLRQRHFVDKFIEGLHPGLVWMGVSLAISRFQPFLVLCILHLYSSCRRCNAQPVLSLTFVAKEGPVKLQAAEQL